MPVLFKTLLTEAGINPRDVKVLRHNLNGVDLFAAWRHERREFEAWQAVQKRSSKGHFSRPWWAAFVSTPEDGALFVGLYEAHLVGECPAGYVERINPTPGDPSTLDLYDCQLSPALAEYAGRLQISFTGRNWRQNGESGHIVTEISGQVRDPAFPGLLEFIKPLSEIMRLPEAWRSHLQLGRGIYLLTCPLTKEQYVGKADGSEGFLGRWLGYARDGHGGNIRLKSRKPSDYQVTVLEVAGSSATPRDIAAMEEGSPQSLFARPRFEARSMNNCGSIPAKVPYAT